MTGAGGGGTIEAALAARDDLRGAGVGAGAATGGTATPTLQTNTAGQGALPDAIRLNIDLPASTGVRGRITLDWVRPNFSNTKT